MKLAAAGLLCALMTACGGSSTPEVTPETASPQGYWQGPIANGSRAYMTVLENGEIWGFTHTSTAGLWGTVSNDGFQLKGELQQFDPVKEIFYTKNFSGSFYPGETMNITLADGTQLPMQYETLYDLEIDPRKLAGTYEARGGLIGVSTREPVSLVLPSGEVVQGSKPIESFVANGLSVADSGDMHISTDKDCVASGTVLPRASGKNVFDVAMTFRGSQCRIEDGTLLKGIAVQRWNGTLSIHAQNKEKRVAFLLFSSGKE